MASKTIRDVVLKKIDYLNGNETLTSSLDTTVELLWVVHAHICL
jgi:hypothetical protein